MGCTLATTIPLDSGRGTADAPSGSDYPGTSNQLAMNLFRRLFARLEIDERLLGMLLSLIVIWIGFHIASDGKFITPRNLYNLGNQTASVAVMGRDEALVFVSVRYTSPFFGLTAVHSGRSILVAPAASAARRALTTTSAASAKA